MKRNKRRSRKKKNSPRWFLILSALVVLVAGSSLIYWFYSDRDKPHAVVKQEEPPVLPAPLKIADPLTKKEPEPSRAQKRTPPRYLAIVIDDIGYDPAAVETLLSFKIPLTFGVLPHCPHSSQSARKIHAAGHEVILHLPMEPWGYPEMDPGEGALFVDMTTQEIGFRLEKNLQAVPHIAGVNNHMGSRFMEEEGHLTFIFSELKKRNLYFLDSFTNHSSKGKVAAETTKIAYIQRNVFLDNNRNQKDSFAVLMELLNNPDRWSKLVIIGHPYPSTLSAIKQALPYLQEQGIELVPLSHLMER